MTPALKKSKASGKAARAGGLTSIPLSKKIVPTKSGQRIKVTENKSSKRETVLISDKTKKKIVLQSSLHKEPDTRSVAVVFKSKLELALLSPYRFPLPNERVVGSVARYAGVFFVVIGAMLSSVHLSEITGVFSNSSDLHSAQIIDSVTTLNVVPPSRTIEDIDAISKSSTMTTVIQPAPTNDVDPEVRVVFSNSEESLKETVTVTVTVGDVSAVRLLLENRKSRVLIPIGTATRVDATTWTFDWNTGMYRDGEYRLKIVSIRDGKSYTYTYGEDVVISNVVTKEPDDATMRVDGDDREIEEIIDDEGVQKDTNADTVNNQASQETQKYSLEIDSGDSANTYIVRVTADENEEVRAYARNLRTGALYFVGKNTINSEGIATFVWDATKLFADTYVVSIRARAGDVFQEVVSEEILIPSRRIESGSSASTTNERTDNLTEGLVPQVTFSIGDGTIVSGATDIVAEIIGDVNQVEVYATPKSSLTPRFIGLAQRKEEDTWEYVWSTKESPNGDYIVFLRMHSAPGQTESTKKQVRVQNEMMQDFTEEQEQEISKITDVFQDLNKVYVADDAMSSTTHIEADTVYIKAVPLFIEELQISDADDQKAKLQDILVDFKRTFDGLLDQFAQAERTGDTEALKRVKDEMETLRREVLESVPKELSEEKLIDSIGAYIAHIIYDLQELTSRNERILRERIGDAVLADSDKDGISDYDELNLYGTNPFTADTDGDGYIDSTEIAQGFDPHNSESEALIAYESPRETGVVREDLLTIESITTLDNESSEAQTLEVSEPRALISGRGLPNSFVTLYIFSTPIVVTVKTGADGSWNYILDKELENGSHEVYVGITDNTGRVVAKSNPIPFVKTAEAFEGIAPAVQDKPVPIEEPSFMNQEVLLLSASLAVVGLGLVLMLLGIYTRNSREAPMLALKHD